MQASAQDNPGVIAFPPLIFALCVVLGIALYAIFPIRVLALVPSRISGVTLILREERYLAAKFGEPYGTYRSQVRRWL
jgi:protein-S-isoprenylcysteine O-methyltransferase Ste14